MPWGTRETCRALADVTEDLRRWYASVLAARGREVFHSTSQLALKFCASQALSITTK